MRKNCVKYAAWVTAWMTGLSGIGSVNVMAEPNKYTNTGFAMDTIVSETIYSDGEDICDDVMEILNSLDRDYLSWTEGETEIGKINAESGSFVEVSEEVADWLTQILQISEDSEGALDPTMGEIIGLWDIDGGNTVVPDEEEIEKLLEHVGYEKVAVDGDKVRLEEGTTLNLGAEGKGIGCDRVMEFLRTQPDVSSALINLGGSSVMTYGYKPDGNPWRIAITDPRDNRGDYLGVVSLGADEYLSTSGDYEKFFMENDVRYHHIMDPKTGAPSRSGLMSVTIVCDRGICADALSTACFVLGREKGMELAALYGADALLVDEEFQVYVSEGMEERFTLMKDGYRMAE